MDAIGAKIQSLYLVSDPFIEEVIIAQAKSIGLGSVDNTMTQSDFEVKLNEQFKEVSGIKPLLWNTESISRQNIDAKTGTYKEICTLGLLMMKFVAEPLMTTSRYDQIQVCFYPMNNQSGGARIYSTSSYPVIIDDFKKLMEDHMFKNPNISVNRFLSLIDKKIVNDFENPVYGLSAEMEQKSKLRKLNKKILKELSDAEIAAYGLPSELVSIRDRIKVKDKVYFI